MDSFRLREPFWISCHRSSPFQISLGERATEPANSTARNSTVVKRGGLFARPLTTTTPFLKIDSRGLQKRSAARGHGALTQLNSATWKANETRPKEGQFRYV
jgi:hypothetical protein